MKLVAISGWKRSGKDTVAKFLIEQFGYKRVAFADPLKDFVAEQYNIPRSYCDDPKFKESPLLQYPVIPKDDFSLTIAKFMIREFRDVEGRMVPDYYIDASNSFVGILGQEVVQLYWTPRALCILEGSTRRSVESNYWINKMIDKIDFLNKEQNNSGLFECSDLRYSSEIKQLRQAFKKDLLTVRINRFDTCDSLDPSERDLDHGKFDLIIENKGTIEDLFNKLKEIKWN